MAVKGQPLFLWGMVAGESTEPLSHRMGSCQCAPSPPLPCAWVGREGRQLLRSVLHSPWPPPLSLP